MADTGGTAAAVLRNRPARGNSSPGCRNLHFSGCGFRSNLNKPDPTALRTFGSKHGSMWRWRRSATGWRSLTGDGIAGHIGKLTPTAAAASPPRADPTHAAAHQTHSPTISVHESKRKKSFAAIPPFRELQSRQQHTRLRYEFRPMCTRGSTWSRHCIRLAIRRMQ